VWFNLSLKGLDLGKLVVQLSEAKGLGAQGGGYWCNRPENVELGFSRTREERCPGSGKTERVNSPFLCLSFFFYYMGL
jgi:hypothetical protein